MATPEGYATPNGSSYRYVYQYKDHLGNTRLSYTKNDAGTLEIVEESNYYPFGLTHKGYNNAVSSLGNSTAQLLKFGGKEEQNELGLGWIDITARNYDPALGRWMNLDPLAEQMRRHSPYNFAFDNPIFFIDPDGNMPCPNGDCGDGPSASGGAIDSRSGTEKFVDGVKSIWNYFTSSSVSTGDKAKTVYEATAPDKLGLALMDGLSQLPQVDMEVNVEYDGEFVKEAVGEAMSIAPLLRVESTVATVERKAGSIETITSNAADDVVVNTTRPSSFRKKTVTDAWDNATNGSSNNTKACPTCGNDVSGNPRLGETRNTDSGWDVSHNPSWSNRDLSKLKSRKEVLDNYNKGTALECRGCNRSAGNNDSRFNN